MTVLAGAVETLSEEVCAEGAVGVFVPLRFLSCISFSSPWAVLKDFKISTGKSAIPMERFPKVPIRAAAPPEIGSQGPSSVSYSRGL